MNAKNGAAKAENDNTAAENLPLFFKAPHLVELEAHEKSGLKKEENYSFTRGANSMPLNAIEFIEAVKSFPIVFTMDENPTPAAVTGLEQENYFVDAKGKWLERAYVPGYARQYPFILFEREGDENLYLCVDEESDTFEKTASKSSLPFYKEGEAALVTQNALAFCTAYYNDRKMTADFCNDLKEFGVLEPSNSKATLADGREISLSGFQMIDEKKFNALSDEQIKTLRDKNTLGFVYLALASYSNWQALVNLAAKQPSAKKK